MSADHAIRGQPDYGNWVSVRLIVVPTLLALALFAVAGLLSAPLWVAVMLLVLGASFVAMAAYFAHARYRLSGIGGDVQGRILQERSRRQYPLVKGEAIKKRL